MTLLGISHLDVARDMLHRSLLDSWDQLGLEKILVIEDSFGHFSLAVWGSQSANEALKGVLEEVAPFNGTIFVAPEPGAFDPLELDASWEDALPIGENEDRIRWVVRHRMLPAWQACRRSPLWSSSEGCPIVAFYSFKGGMGRSTALTAFALERSRRDEHVVVVDLDLDAPGLGSTLPTDSASPYGVVDYLIESPVLGKRPDDLLDYSWRVPLTGVRTSGTLRVFPAGKLDEHYLGKMARLDFEKTEGMNHPLEELLMQIHETWKPDWILLDSRTGFSETAGMLLSGLAHYYVLLGVDSEQSWQGLTYAVRKLGAERLLRGWPQAEILMVQGLVPELKREQKDSLKQRFLERSEDLFREEYYSAEIEGEKRDDEVWYLDDMPVSEAPHRSQHLSYLPELAQSTDIADLLDALDGERGGYATFCFELSRRTIEGDRQ